MRLTSLSVSPPLTRSSSSSICRTCEHAQAHSSTPPSQLSPPPPARTFFLRALIFLPTSTSPTASHLAISATIRSLDATFAVWHQRVAAVRLAVAADEASGGGDSEVWWRRECWRRRRRMRNHACAAVGVRAPRAALGRRAWSAPISISTPSRADLGLR